MALLTGPFHLCWGVALGDRGVAFDALHSFRHDIWEAFFLPEGLSLNKPDLCFMAIRTVRSGLMMTLQTLHPRLVNLSVFFP